MINLNKMEESLDNLESYKNEVTPSTVKSLIKEIRFWRGLLRFAIADYNSGGRVVSHDKLIRQAREHLDNTTDMETKETILCDMPKPCYRCGCQRLVVTKIDDEIRKEQGFPLLQAVQCVSCSVLGPERKTEMEAIDAWNNIKSDWYKQKEGE